MLGELLLTVGVGLIGYALYILSTNNAKYFEERNLTYVGMLPFLKGILKATFGRIDVLSMVKNMYEAVPDDP